MRSTVRSSVLLLFFAISVGACGDPFGTLDPQVVTDTISLTVPTADNLDGGPSALDITAAGGFIRGGRHPERTPDATEWDLALRAREGQLVFVPPAALNFETRAGISPPLAGQTFEGLRDVPPGTRFVSDSAMVVQPGAVYVVRSRDFALAFFGGCVQYAKLQPLEVDAEAGTVSVQVATNGNCYDTRLVNAGG